MLNIILWIIISLLSGVVGSFFTTPAIPVWYAALNKPFFNPPNWIFAPVWTLLYILMGIAMGFVANTKIKEKNTRNNAYYLFLTQLFLNSLWSIIFFGLRQPLIAFIEIIFLLGLIIVMTRYFYKIKKEASYLLYPYIGWVSFASILNLFIFILN